MFGNVLDVPFRVVVEIPKYELSNHYRPTSPVIIKDNMRTGEGEGSQPLGGGRNGLTSQSPFRTNLGARVLTAASSVRWPLSRNGGELRRRW